MDNSAAGAPEVMSGGAKSLGLKFHSGRYNQAPRIRQTIRPKQEYL
jgi:hypothetical protein